MPTAIKVFFPKDGDPYIEASSLEDALALVKTSSNGHAAQHLRFPRTESSPIPEANIMNFLVSVNENARKLLVALVKHGNGVTGEEFSEETGVGSEKFGGIFGGASKIAKNYGLKIQQFVRSEMVVKGSNRYRFYRPGKLLLENAEKLKQAAKENAGRIE